MAELEKAQDEKLYDKKPETPGKFKVIINIPEVEDALYEYRKITVEPFYTKEEALNNFYVLAHMFIHKWLASESSKKYETMWQTEWYYEYNDAYQDERDFWLGGVYESYD